MSIQVYRLILGGPESDQRLHKTALELVSPHIPGRKVLDTGIGDARFTRKLVPLGPSEFWISDYDQSAVDRGFARIRRDGTLKPETELVGRQLDVSGELETLGDQLFDVIICISVMMHLGAPQSAAGTRALMKRLRPNGGKLFLGVLCADVARNLFIPATSVGDDWFYPQLKGLPEKATEADVPPHALCLRECYPKNGHYHHATQIPGYTSVVHDAVAGEECRGSVYEPIIGQPLWRLHEVTRS